MALPLAFGVGAAVGLFGRLRRSHLFERAAQDSNQILTGMNWEDFERLVADTFTRAGYEVRERGGAQADGGVDLVVYRDSRRFLVQCKQWRSKKVSVAAVRELLGVVSASAADGGFLVSASSFTKEAEAFANGRSIRLLDNARLHAMMHQAGPARGSAPTSVRSAATVPRCPTCSSLMVKRVAQKGRGTGEPFWGCSNFPRCRAVRSIT
jgi:restriction system protein